MADITKINLKGTELNIRDAGAARSSDLAAKQDTLTFDNAPTANSNNPVKSGGVYTALATKQDAIADLATIRTGAGKGATALQPSDVSIDAPSTPDGTFTLNVGSNKYSVNLNHTHEGMAKLVKCTEATLPQTLADDTIYVQVDNLTTPTEIEALYIFGLEFTGGGAPAGTPEIKNPVESEITLDRLDNGNVIGTVQVQAKNITAKVNIAISGSNFAITAVNGTALNTPISSSNGPLSIEIADALAGAELTIAYSGTTNNAEGTLVVSSAAGTPEFTAKSVGLTAVGVLPSGYTRLEYVENATQGIKTNVDALTSLSSPDLGTKWRIDVKANELPVTKSPMLFCTSWDSGHFLGCNKNDGKFFITGSSFPQDCTERSVFDIEFITAGIKVTCNGTTLTGRSTATIPYNHVIGDSNSTTIAKVCILNDMNTTPTPDRVFTGRLYSVKCTYGGSFDGYPALNNATNKHGIYDLANNVFYPIET